MMVLIQLMFLCTTFVRILFLFSVTVMCTKYDFDIFENFEITRDSFLKEQKTVENLKELKGIFHNTIITFHQLIDQFPGVKQSKLRPMHNKGMCNVSLSIYKKPRFWKNASQILYYTRMTGEEAIKEVYNFNYSSDEKSIIIGARKGIVVLQETYDININNLVDGSFLKENSTLATRKIDSLKLDDLVSLSIIAAYIYQWLDNSLVYLKEARNVKYWQLFSNKHGVWEHFKDILSSISYWLSKKNSEMHYNNHNVIDADTNTYPYIIDNGCKRSIYSPFQLIMVIYI